MMFHTSLRRLRGVGAAAALGAVLLALGGCSSTGSTTGSFIGVLRPYKIDILQGNVVTREQVDALQTGMPREQVRAILGTPLLVSAFHADRWDYVFTFKRQGQEPQRRQVTVYFQGDAVARVESDESLPTEAEFVSSLDVRRKGAKVPPLEATEEQLKAFDAKNRPAAPSDTAAPAPMPAASYPPLESR